MKALWALVKVLDEIRGQLVRLNINLESEQYDYSQQPGEPSRAYWDRLRRQYTAEKRG